MEITRGDIFIADLNPVQGSEQDNLLGGVEFLQVLHCHVDSAAHGALVHAVRAVHAHVLELLATLAALHLLGLLGEPAAQREVVVIVVGAQKYDDGIHILTHFLMQFIRQSHGMRPLWSQSARNCQ